MRKNYRMRKSEKGMGNRKGREKEEIIIRKGMELRRKRRE